MFISSEVAKLLIILFVRPFNRLDNFIITYLKPFLVRFSNYFSSLVVQPSLNLLHLFNLLKLALIPDFVYFWNLLLI